MRQPRPLGKPAAFFVRQISRGRPKAGGGSAPEAGRGARCPPARPPRHRRRAATRPSIPSLSGPAATADLIARRQPHGPARAFSASGALLMPSITPSLKGRPPMTAASLPAAHRAAGIRRRAPTLAADRHTPRACRQRTGPYPLPSTARPEASATLPWRPFLLACHRPRHRRQSPAAAERGAARKAKLVPPGAPGPGQAAGKGPRPAASNPPCHRPPRPVSSPRPRPPCPLVDTFRRA
ncbi:hypothetical protein C8N33_10550 [Pararhodobacter aggregans]|nr:hypothetical protein C8N33_10550 [Pararhodobacter aggregans]